MADPDAQAGDPGAQWALPDPSAPIPGPQPQPEPAPAPQAAQPSQPAQASPPKPEADPKSVKRRLTSARTWLVGAILAGLAAGITTIVSNLVASSGAAVTHIVTGPGSGSDPGTSPGSGGGAGSAGSASPASAATTPTGAVGSAASPQVTPTTNGTAITTSDGVYITAYTNDGMGCEGAGYVFPAAASPGLTTTTTPGTGPTHDGKTWDTDPSAFGAVSAPGVLTIDITGPTTHAIVITGITFHVLSRKPQVVGPWFTMYEGCGGGGVTYLYGAVDFDRAAPYWVPTQQLPSYEVSSSIAFPYNVTANTPAIFLIDLSAKSCECTWDADISWVDDGSTLTTKIDHSGQPFVFTSTTGETGFNWLEDPGSGWTESANNY